MMVQWMMVKLKNRRVYCWQSPAGDFFFEFKNLVGRRDVQKTKLRLTEEAAFAVCDLVNHFVVEGRSK